MNEEQRIKLLEEELKILKNEVKTILLDIREQYLNIQNPFNFSMVPNTGTPPAGPDQKDRDEAPLDEFNFDKDNQPDAASEFDDLSFGKPFADLSANEDEAKPGPGMPPEIPESPLSAGPGPGAGSEPEMTAEPEEEEPEPEPEPEPPKKSKSSKKKKNVEPVEMEPEMEAEEPMEDDIEPEDKIEDKLISKGVSPKNGKKRTGVAVSSRADLVVIAGLTQWVDQATGKLGKDRTEALVEMSNAMGRIPDNIKDVLIRMVRISRYESSSEQSPLATDYLAVLAQLESLMGGSQYQDNALLSVLSMMKESKRG